MGGDLPRRVLGGELENPRNCLVPCSLSCPSPVLAPHVTAELGERWDTEEPFQGPPRIHLPPSLAHPNS